MKKILFIFFIIFLKKIKLNSNFHSIPQLKIDEKDKFKYIQILCNKTKIFIWGSKKFKFHKNIYE